jgi:hypothetical protein
VNSCFRRIWSLLCCVVCLCWRELKTKALRIHFNLTN